MNECCDVEEVWRDGCKRKRPGLARRLPCGCWYKLWSNNVALPLYLGGGGRWSKEAAVTGTIAL